MNRLAVLVLGAILSGNAAAVDQELESMESGVSAAAQRTYSLTEEPKPIRLDFDFRIDESKGWLIESGDFQIRGWVQHVGLLCATYRTGMRFGVGAPGCLNVEWITEPVFVTSHLQCNGARINHLGDGSDPDLGGQLSRVTCAERIVRCTGNCR